MSNPKKKKCRLAGTYNRCPLIKNTTNLQYNELLFFNLKFKSQIVADSFFLFQYKNEIIKLINNNTAGYLTNTD